MKEIPTTNRYLPFLQYIVILFVRGPSLFFYHPGLKEISNITMDWKNTNLPPVAVMTVWSGDPLASLGMLRVFWGGDSWDMGGSIILNGIPNHYWGQMSHSKRI